jgi:hypothetical protein
VSGVADVTWVYVLPEAAVRRHAGRTGSQVHEVKLGQTGAAVGRSRVDLRYDGHSESGCLNVREPPVFGVPVALLWSDSTYRWSSDSTNLIVLVTGRREN